MYLYSRAVGFRYWLLPNNLLQRGGNKTTEKKGLPSYRVAADFPFQSHPGPQNSPVWHLAHVGGCMYRHTGM